MLRVSEDSGCEKIGARERKERRGGGGGGGGGKGKWGGGEQSAFISI